MIVWTGGELRPRTMRLQRGFRWINVLNVLRKSQAYKNVPLLGAHMVFRSAPPQTLKLQPGH